MKQKKPYLILLVVALLLLISVVVFLFLRSRKPQSLPEVSFPEMETETVEDTALNSEAVPLQEDDFIQQEGIASEAPEETPLDAEPILDGDYQTESEDKSPGDTEVTIDFSGEQPAQTKKPTAKPKATPTKEPALTPEPTAEAAPTEKPTAEATVKPTPKATESEWSPTF